MPCTKVSESPTSPLKFIWRPKILLCHKLVYCGYSLGMWPLLVTLKATRGALCIISCRGHAHCKIVRKYCMFRVPYRTHFSHIAASPYAKWLNADSWLTGGSRITQHYLQTVMQAPQPCGPALLSGQQVQSMKDRIWIVCLFIEGLWPRQPHSHLRAFTSSNLTKLHKQAFNI